MAQKEKSHFKGYKANVLKSLNQFNRLQLNFKYYC